jgi:hypothetical protein
MLGVLCVALTLTLTFGALFVAKKIPSTENRDSSEFIDEVFCQRSVASTKYRVDEVSVDEMLCRQKFFDEQHSYPLNHSPRFSLFLSQRVSPVGPVLVNGLIHIFSFA